MTDIVQRNRNLLLSELRSIFDGAEECDFADFPHHFNCGDHAIWLGCLKIAEEFGISVGSVTSSATYRRQKLKAAGPIVINGGGNFGGLYPHHDELRIRILTDFVDRPVVQMPQSIEVTNPDLLERLKRAIGQHPDFTLLVRDHRSLAIAQKEFDCQIKLVPDAVFALGNLLRDEPRDEVVIQARQDDEAAFRQRLDHPTVDWCQANIFSLRNLGRSAVSGAGKFGGSTLTPIVAHRFAQQNLRCAVRTVSRGRVLVTDRLHGHVIATLCGIKHIVVNDRYGKVRALWEAWTRDAPMATFVPTWQDAHSALAGLTDGRLAS